MIMLRGASLSALVAMASLSGALASFPVGCEPAAHPPALDPTFGGNGYVHAVTARNAVVLSTIDELSDGKIVVGGNTFGYLGDGLLVGLRYLADGTLDPSFHGDGIVALNPCHCTGFRGGIAGFRLQEDGSLLFVGSTALRAEPGQKRHEGIALLRYREDGTRGVEPGDSGIDVVDLEGDYSVRAAAFLAEEEAVLVAGHHENRLFVAKVRERGTDLDTTFAEGRGWVAPIASGSASGAGAMAVDDDGRIVIAGWIEDDRDRDAMVMRLLPDGAPDESFGARGVVRLARAGSQQARGITLLSDGRILVGGDTNDADARRFLLLRLLPGGELDPSFGDAGIALAPLGRADPYQTHRVSMVTMQDGRLLVGSNAVVDAETSRPVIARFLSDGSLDPTFGEGGEATFAVKKGPDWVPSPKYGHSEETQLTTLSLTRDGKLLVTGTWSAYPFQGFLARLLL
ncbi:Hemolysin-type calcium-binding region [Minicystis rosea]|nr:Hemolysin-type calcium-binding region [Minicystis rosea]